MTALMIRLSCRAVMTMVSVGSVTLSARASIIAVPEDWPAVMVIEAEVMV